MTGTGFLNLIKTHGLSIALMLGGLYFLNDKLNNAEARILAVEERLHNCYEKLIVPKTSSRTAQNSETVVFVKPKDLEIVPEDV